VLKLAGRAAKEGVVEKSEVQETFKRELAALQSNFGWLSFDFCDSVPWNAGYYASLVAEKAVLGEAGVAEEAEANARYEENALRDFESVKRELGLSENEAALFEVVRDIGFYKWAREQVFQQATFRIKSVQDELGARVGMPSTLESKYVLCGEWNAALGNPREFVGKAKLRTRNCLMLVSRSGTKLLEGVESEQEFSKMVFVAEKIDERASEFRGTPACAGLARGRVSVINVLADAGKMKQGDVLVSVATTPDLVPVMKRASAIVTSEGGVTCHAAIVSRELGVPCVVGVRGIHKALRDGDEVEVDATNGVVKRI
jgi:phosphoenolpyruvate synthase/pyruvate phosphate dikinase